MTETTMRDCSMCGHEYDGEPRDGWQKHHEEAAYEHARYRVLGAALRDGESYTHDLMTQRLLRWEREIAAAASDAAAAYDMDPFRRQVTAFHLWAQSDPKISGYRISHHGLGSWKSIPRSLGSMRLDMSCWVTAGIVLTLQQKDGYSIAKHIDGLFSPFTEKEANALLAAAKKILGGPMTDIRVETGIVQATFPKYALYGNTRVAFSNGFAHDPPASALPWLPKELMPEGWR